MNITELSGVLGHIANNVSIAREWCKGIQFYDKMSEKWIDLTGEGIYINPKVDYRIKPNTIIVNGIEINAPVDHVEHGAAIYFINPSLKKGYSEDVYYNQSSFQDLLIERGLVHLVEENAKTHVKALGWS